MFHMKHPFFFGTRKTLTPSPHRDARPHDSLGNDFRAIWKPLPSSHRDAEGRSRPSEATLGREEAGQRPARIGKAALPQRTALAVGLVLSIYSLTDSAGPDCSADLSEMRGTFVRKVARANVMVM